MPSSPTEGRYGWARAQGAVTSHLWRPGRGGEGLVSLCLIRHGDEAAERAGEPGRCPVCREGLRRATVVRRFLEGHIHLDAEAGGRLMTVEPWYWWGVILPLYGTLEPDGEGGYRRVYSKGLIGVPRWHIKSTTAAALALYHMALEPLVDTEAYAVATSLKQAGAVFRKARRMVRADELLSRLFYSPKSVIECRETGATFAALPHDADTAQGFHPQFAAIDEIHVHRNRDMIDAMVSGSAGFSQPMVLCITTAGAERKGVWWQLLKEWTDDPGTYIFWCGAGDEDDPTDPAVWRRANPASWITDDMLRRQFRAMPLASFCRYHLNLAPKTGTNRIISEPLWTACSVPPTIELDRPCVIAVDASLRRDHTAVVFDQLDEHKCHNVLCFTFTAEEDGSIMRAIDHDEVGNLLRDLAAGYRVNRLPCDRAYFVRTMRQLLDEGLPIEEFPQTHQNMARACQRMYDAITEERIRHGGDPVLTEHVMNAAPKETPFGWRITKAESSAHIDAAVALAMAVDVAEAEADESAPGAMVG